MLAAFVALAPVIMDTDFHWHLRTGRWIVENRALPPGDIYTFAPSSKPWTDHEWLGEVLLWLVYSRSGSTGVSLFFGLIAWLGLLAVLGRALLFKPPYPLLALAVAAVVLAGAPVWNPRIEMVTFALGTVELYWLERFLRAPSLLRPARGPEAGWLRPLGGLRRLPGICLLPVVMVAWANLHGGWPIAFCFLGAALVAEIVHWRLSGDALARSRVVLLLLVAAACALALFLTPYGWRAVVYPFLTQGSPAQQSLIDEWQSPNFHHPNSWPLEGLLLLTLVGFGLRRPRLYDLLLTLGTLVLTLQSLRHVVFFAAAVVPPLVGAYGQAWTDLATRRGWPIRSSVAGPGFATVASVGLLVMTAATAQVVARQLAGQSAVDAANYPVAASAWIAAHPHACRRMFNDYGWGGYLIYRFYSTAHRPFVFGEAALMGDDRLREYAGVVYLGPDWLRTLDRYGVDCVVFDHQTPFTDALAAVPAWERAYSDRVTDIFLRRGGDGASHPTGLRSVQSRATPDRC